MRYILFIIIISSVRLNAQFVSANVKVDGLTCSMCQKAAHSALKDLPFVETITPDIEGASFKLVFKKGVAVDPVVIRTKIEEAGFSVGELVFKVDLGKLTKISDTFFLYDIYYFNVVTEMNAEHGIREYKVLDKGFISQKEYNKNAKDPKYKCVYNLDGKECNVKIENNYPIIHLASR